MLGWRWTIYRMACNRGRTSQQFQRSLYTVKDIAEGKVLSAEHLRGGLALGLSPAHFEEVLGRRARQTISRGTSLAWSLLQ